MSEELRHKFNRLGFYTILFTFLSVSMTFIIFTSVAQPTRTCPTGQFVNIIGTASDSCGAPGNINTQPLASDLSLDCPANQFCGGGLTGLTVSTGIGAVVLPSNNGKIDVFSNLLIKVNVTSSANAFTFILYRNQSLNFPAKGVSCNVNQASQPNLIAITPLSISPPLAAVAYTFTATWAETQPGFVTSPATAFVYFWCANFEPVAVRFTFVGKGSFQGQTLMAINEF